MTVTDRRLALDLEITGREMTGRVISGRPARAIRLNWLGVPAAVLMLGVIGLPALYTLGRAFWVEDSGAVGLGNFTALLADPGTQRAITNSLGWVLVALAVCVFGFALALLSRRVRWFSKPLVVAVVAPVAVSMLVTGVAFRLLYEPSPDRGTVSAVVVGVHDVFVGRAPAAGARPTPNPASRAQLSRDTANGGLLTDGSFTLGESVELRLSGVAVAGEGAVAAPKPAGPGQLTGTVSSQGHPLARVPVLALSFGQQVGRGETGPDGGFVISPAAGGSLSRYSLEIPSDAIAPPWRGPQWLGVHWVWLVLIMAFVWAWMGFAVSLFRAGLDALPDDALRMARNEGVGRWRRLQSVVLPMLRPVTSVVLLTIVVAAVRLFDLMLVMVPGSVQGQADVVALNWWRGRGLRPPGESAALALLLFLAVALVALFGMRGLRHHWPRRVVSSERSRRTSELPWLNWSRWNADRRQRGARRSGGTGPQRWLSAGLAAVVAVLWMLPLLSLLASALHTPRDAAIGGWWQVGSGLSLDSFATALSATGGDLAQTFGSTLITSTTATALVLLAAVPAAYLLAWGELPRWLSRAAVVVFGVLAVAPVQLYAAPLTAVFGEIGLAGSRLALIVVHVAVGVPFATLLLRSAFLTAPAALALSARIGETGRSTAIQGVLRHGADAVVAVAVLEFVLVWNDFTVGLLTSGPGGTPLSSVLWGEARQFATSTGTVAAGAMVSAVLPLGLVLLTWPRVVRGLTGGVLR